MKIRTILPCTKNNLYSKSEELLKNHNTKETLIEFHLKTAINPLIITVKEKVDLIEFADKNGIETLVIESNGNLNDDILKSKELWEEQTIIVNPVTNYERENIIDDFKIFADLNLDLTIAYHSFKNVVNFGTFDIQKSKMCSRNINTKVGFSCGILMFSKDYGETLLKKLNGKRWFELPKHSSLCLTKCEDLTKRKDLVY